MDDLISRQAALDALNRIEISRNASWYEFYQKALTVVGTLPSARQWIPTSERLPKVREWVLCQCRAGIMDVLRLTEDGNWNKNYPHVEYMSGFVIAWMPLPEPWKGGKE